MGKYSKLKDEKGIFIPAVMAEMQKNMAIIKRQNIKKKRYKKRNSPKSNLSENASKKDNDSKLNLKNRFISENIRFDDVFNIANGLIVLERIMQEKFKEMDFDLFSREEDISKLKVTFWRYKNVLIDLIKRVKIQAKNEQIIQHKIDLLEEEYQMFEAAVGGVLTKKEKCQKMINGEMKETIRDVPVQPREVFAKLIEYKNIKRSLIEQILQGCIGIGLASAGVYSAIANEKSENQSGNTARIISIGTTAVGGIRLIQGVLQKNDRKEWNELEEEQIEIIRDFIETKQISTISSNEIIQNLRKSSEKEKKISAKIENKRLTMDLMADLATAMILGLYINSKAELTKDGNIEIKSLINTLMSIKSAKSEVGMLIDSIFDLLNSMDKKDRFQDLCEIIQDYHAQLEQKVKDLKGANKPFKSLNIEKFVGNFKPTFNYEKGEVEYGCSIEVSEFSMKQGDIVYLSGDSTAGKSTFLDYLKNGNINNRKAIKVDEQYVDKLGDEAIFFDSDTKLGNAENVLTKITHIHNFSDLDMSAKQRLLTLLSELELNYSMEELATRRYSQFALGERKRLDFLALLYRMGENPPSVVIADEPFNNVQQDLLKKEMKLLIDYAKKYNIMLVFTTHSKDIVPYELITKRYHITKVDKRISRLEQVEIEKDIHKKDDDAR